MTPILHHPLRDALWLTGDRARAAATVWLAAILLLLAALPLVAPSLVVGADFVPLWAAAGLASAGDGAAAYGAEARAAVAARLGPAAHWPFAYPPTALLLWSPFATLSFPVALAAWLGLSAAAYLTAMRALAGTAAFTAALAFPAVTICVLYGQNSLLSAALFAGAAVLLDRRPVLAGVLLGCLAFKPQLAVLVPLVLIAAGRWRSVAGAAVTLAALVAASVACFGAEAWAAYLPVLQEVRELNTGGVSGFDRFAGVYPAARILGVPAAAAWTAQAMMAALAAIMLFVTARRRPGGRAELAMLVAATGLCVPFLGEYDLAIMAVPGFWLKSDALRTGWLPYERLGLAVLYFAPAVIVAASVNGIPLGPLVPAALAALVFRRASRTAPVVSSPA
ncbi:glycosyltransferase family 87 protein [Emcibacter sp. SYSU 3D8]|uniref:glycosyltransferase family 87 protein n=1 Tax=Emcibacter sp. SYSU 3D8 TaxID=3133969 RepID=UPI0031FEEF70